MIKKEGDKVEIVIKSESNKTLVEVTGRVDSNTSPQLQSQLEEYYNQEGFALVLDFAELEFVSSAGLRVLLLMHKMGKAKGGTVTLRNVRPEIMDVFEMTGFIDFLTIEG
jgi:anti-anti-sigma factor